MGLWRFHVYPAAERHDPAGRRVLRTLDEFGITSVDSVRASRLFLIDLSDPAADSPAIVRRIADELLTDPVVERCVITHENEPSAEPPEAQAIEVHLRPGVMDSTADSTALALADMGISAVSVRTARRYELRPPPPAEDLPRIRRLLANECIEELFVGTRPTSPPPKPTIHGFHLRQVAIRELDEAELADLSRRGHLFLSIDEMRAIQRHYRRAGRDPTDLELETLAQTWSEHCVHKTLKSAITYRGAPFPGRQRAGDRRAHAANEDGGRAAVTVQYDNLLRDTIARATEELIREGRGPECLSVFADNAGIIGFDEQHGVAFKVETHNHPSALEPYGGAATGVGGVIRDVLGCGLGAKPIANTDVFCVAPPDWPVDALPRGIIHPKAVLRGVVAGVRDYGNRMGIPTVNGAVCFDPRFLGNPLVYCGCVGVIPRNRIAKGARPGNAIVLMGGRTGRDGIHGATFSSAELTTTHEDEFAHAVQIGNPIEEKKVLDVILQAREGGRAQADSPGEPDCLFTDITDCGAGGLSSAIGEMAQDLGAEVQLDRVPLKYAGLRYDEIWISEAQERMVLAVPPENIEPLLALARSEDVEATVIGTFTDSGRLVVRHGGTVVGDLDLAFLHGGLPKKRKTAEWWPSTTDPAPRQPPAGRGVDLTTALKDRLSAPETASKHWIIHQYDHEVQAGSVIKPLVGPRAGPTDAAVIRPRLDSARGMALSCGLAPEIGDRDPYWMAVSAIDEAVRNVVCVGGDPRRAAILDNFCWPSSEDPRALGALVRACQACYDTATAYGLPFISGKDSLNNVFAMSEAEAARVREAIAKRRHRGEPAIEWSTARDRCRLSIPFTLLISAVALVDDVARCITSLPRVAEGQTANLLFVGFDADGWDGIELAAAARLHLAVADLIREGGARAVHDVSDGGIAVAVAEMAFGGDFDVNYHLPAEGRLSDPFARPPSAYIVQPAWDPDAVRARFEAVSDLRIEPVATLAPSGPDGLFRFVRGKSVLAEEPISALRHAWRQPLDW